MLRKKFKSNKMASQMNVDVATDNVTPLCFYVKVRQSSDIINTFILIRLKEIPEKIQRK